MSKNIINKIKSTLTANKILYKESNESSLIVPYRIEELNEYVNIAFFMNGNTIVGITFFRIKNKNESSIFKFCSTFNRLHTSPKLYASFGDTPPSFLCEINYDLDIFPEEYIEKWVLATIKKLLSTIKELRCSDY
jgi:hypothetical protein